MGKIQQLPEEVAIKIAAGEVVERPSSVVKELIENSIDAGATQIEITLENGGKTFISIRDNGSGMDREDAAKAFLRHGTSKIKSVDDLMQVATLGFRGEALAAIAASSEVDLTTSLENAGEGTQVLAQNASITAVKPHAPLTGTTITVKELFSSIPARQKFLKSDTTEWKTTLETITKQMMVHPEIGFAVQHNSRTVYKLFPSQSFIERVAAIWKIDQNKLFSVLAESPHLTIRGVITTPQIAHETKGRQFLSVNKHPIHDKALARAVKDAYGTTLPPGTQPAYALTIAIHPGMVDVNIHLRKDEVRFVNPQEVFRFLFLSVSQTLSLHNLAFQSVGEWSQKNSDSPVFQENNQITKSEKLKSWEEGRGDQEISGLSRVGTFTDSLSVSENRGRGLENNFPAQSPAPVGLSGSDRLEQFDPELDRDRKSLWGIAQSEKSLESSPSPPILTLSWTVYTHFFRTKDLTRTLLARSETPQPQRSGFPHPSRLGSLL